MLSIFSVLLFLPHLFASGHLTQFRQLKFNNGASSPDGVVLDPFNRGPYATVRDGRILKYNGFYFEDFAYTSPNRTKKLCDGTVDNNLSITCGRPVDMSFNQVTGGLYIADANLGLFKVGPRGGKATLITNKANGVPFKFLDGVIVDKRNRFVYFTDASSKYTFQDFLEGRFPPTDSTGRLMQYDIGTGQVKVLLQGLTSPVGAALGGDDDSYLVFTQFYKQNVVKYWLKGPNKNRTQVILRVPGFPARIKSASKPGEFWVPVNLLPLGVGVGYKFNSNGQVLFTKILSGQYEANFVDVLQEYSINGTIVYVGAMNVDFVGMYSCR